MRGLLISVLEGGYAVTDFQGSTAELQAAVGGWIEPAPSDPSVTLWVNEEGKRAGLPVNRLAMDAWIRWDIYGCMTAGADWLAGNAVVTGGADRHGRTLDITPEAHRWVLRVARDAGARVDVTWNPWDRFGLVERTEES